MCTEGPATGHLDTGFSWFPCVYERMLSWFPTFQDATTCFSCSPPDLNSVETDFMFLFTCKKNHCHRGRTQSQSINIIIIYIILIDRSWHSSILDVRSIRGADCDTDHYLVVEKVRELVQFLIAPSSPIFIYIYWVTYTPQNFSFKY